MIGIDAKEEKEFSDIVGTGRVVIENGVAVTKQKVRHPTGIPDTVIYQIVECTQPQQVYRRIIRLGQPMQKKR